jgi:hypothetical protein
MTRACRQALALTTLLAGSVVEHQSNAGDADEQLLQS